MKKPVIALIAALVLAGSHLPVNARAKSPANLPSEPFFRETHLKGTIEEIIMAEVSTNLHYWKIRLDGDPNDPAYYYVYTDENAETGYKVVIQLLVPRDGRPAHARIIKITRS